MTRPKHLGRRQRRIMRAFIRELVSEASTMIMMGVMVKATELVIDNIQKLETENK